MKRVNEICKEVAEKRPLIHCITNPISINQCANTILAVGARPMMAEHPKEVAEITATADALVLNTGNITDARIDAIEISLMCAKEKDIPTVLDAVGVACSSLRREFIKKILKKAVPTLVKGNYSEIMALYDERYHSSGVDAEIFLDANLISKAAAELSNRLGCMVLATGKRDIIAKENTIVFVDNGNAQLSSVTGTGCMLGALCGTFLSVDSGIDAVVSATAFFGICGELSETEIGYGTFMTRLMDNLSAFNKIDIEKYLRLEEKYEEV